MKKTNLPQHEIKTSKNENTGKAALKLCMRHCYLLRAHRYVKYVRLVAVHSNIHTNMRVTYEWSVVKEAISHSREEGEEGVFETHLWTSMNK